MSVYHGEFSSLEDMCRQFCIKEEHMKDYRVLYACYSGDMYEGNAFVVLEHITTGEWFEVNCAHCSCDGLSWELEPTSKKALIYRAKADKNTMEHVRLIPEMADLLMLL